MTRHFRCTACGACCHGQLPLTCADALAHAGTFPLCFVWTPVHQGSKDFAQVAALGATFPLAGRKSLACLIVPTAYLPASAPCPALGEDQLCRLQAEKPLRCRAMPLYPYREERFQAELLTPRRGWACDTSAEAPVIFEHERVVAREDFDRERKALEEQVPLLRRYVEYMLKYTPTLVASLQHAAGQAKGGNLLTSLSSFLTATRNPDAKRLAQLQLPLLTAWAARTAGDRELAAFHKNYAGWAKEMGYLAQRP